MSYIVTQTELKEQNVNKYQGMPILVTVAMILFG